MPGGCYGSAEFFDPTPFGSFPKSFAGNSLAFSTFELQLRLCVPKQSPEDDRCRDDSNEQEGLGSNVIGLTSRSLEFAPTKPNGKRSQQ